MKKAMIGVIAGMIGLTLGFLPLAHATDANTGGKKILTLYYSLSGNTRELAKQIQAQVGGDLVELETVTPYPDDYNRTVDQAKKELEANYLPPLKTKLENLDSYDVIFLGSPNWWYTLAGPVRTFLSQNNLAGKTVAPFMTHGGGGFANSINDLKAFCPNATILEGLALSGGRAKNAQSDVKRWLNTLGIATGNL
jgi:flavodoxin